MTPSQLEAKRKLKRALNLVEHAQSSLGEACGELAPIVGAINEYRLVGDLYDKVHSAWYEVSNVILREKFDLDSDSKRRLNL